MEVRTLDALLVTSLANVRYLTGFTGSSALAVVTAGKAFLVTDSRYALQSAAEVKGFRRIIGSRGLLEDAAEARALARCRVAGFESDSLTYAQYRSLRALFPRVRFRPSPGIVETLARVKDRREIAAIAGAAAISDRVFSDVLGKIRPGMTEREVASEISRLNALHGSESDAFDVIVASGPRGALPHARPTGRRIRKGDFVIMDFGSTLRGYRSDMTRTVAVGSVRRRLREAYRAVREANESALGAARPEMKARDLDAVARGSIRRAGFGRYFVHSLGHGIGLRIHESPRVSPLSNEVMESGNVITIEPGVYIPGSGGVRIEDDVVLGPGGCRVLTKSPRELIVL